MQTDQLWNRREKKSIEMKKSSSVQRENWTELDKNESSLIVARTELDRIGLK